MTKIKIFSVVLIIVVIAAGSLYAWRQRSKRPISESVNKQTAEHQMPAQNSAEYFVQLADTVELPNLTPVTDPPFITNDQAADEHIQALAEKRGYRLQPLPNSDLIDLEAVRVQEPVVKPWQELKLAAQKEAGISLVIISGYRSVETQRVIFLNQLDLQAREEINRPFTNDEIAKGQADSVIDKILSEYSIPGYSGHHTGYSLDIEDTSSGKPFDEFEDTAGFAWISKNDYQNARRFGFIPGYPIGASNLGPDAEPWEFIWVGKDNLR
jgi:LAS superfamily LD-carboxypeptidase LdcB